MFSPACDARMRASEAKSSSSRVAPLAVLPPEVEAPGARRDPDLAVRSLAIDDHARVVGAGDGEDARLEIAVERIRALDRALDARELGVDAGVEFGLVHNEQMIRALLAALCLALALALCACGQKGPLKMPEPPRPAEPAK